MWRTILQYGSTRQTERNVQLPKTLKSQFDDVFNAIVKLNITIEEIAKIIALYALAAGFKTGFRKRYFTYSNFIVGRPTIVSYSAGVDFQNALLDFSFRGRCLIRFKIHCKGDEMWIGVVGDPLDLDESHSLTRGASGQWAFYCGRSTYDYRSPSDGQSISREKMLASFMPERDVVGNGVGEYGSFHFPNRFLHRLVPVNTGDEVDVEVDAQEKLFTVIVNGTLQASTRSLDLPDQLVFFVQLDDNDDEVEFEILDFSFENKNGKRTKYLE